MASLNSNQNTVLDEEKIEGEMDNGSDNVIDASEVEKGVLDVPGDFPEGGGAAWAVAIGSSAVVFCTLGYINSFG